MISFPTANCATTHSSGARIEKHDGFEVWYLTPATNILVAMQETAQYGVSLSGGLGSALGGDRAVRRHGRENIFFWFSDVKKEDPDLYRFLWDLMRRWGGRLYYFTDGRTPEDVWEKHGIIGNNRMCPCSYELKVFHFREFIKAMPRLPVVYIGYKHDETDRQQRTCASYKEAIPEAIIDYPLTWDPAETRDLAQVCREELGIDPPRVYALGFDYNNCFSGETRFLTPDGPKTFKETVGQTPFVMTTHGVWTQAPIKSFGVQQLWEIKLKRHGVEKSISATASHRWFAYRGERSNGRVELQTAQLTPGTRLVSLYGRSLSRVRPSVFGIAHGLVFGDGTRFSGRAAPASLVLCGEKKAELLRYFPLSPQTKVENIGVRVDDLPRFFKDRPSLDESRSYLYGWLAGYFAADGTVSKDGSVSIDSSSLENLECVRNVCTRLGIGTTSIRTEMRKGYGTKPTPLYTIYLQRRTLKEEFFPRADHLKRIQENAKKALVTPATWVVVSVQPTDRVEEVFCAVVPDTHCFVLEDNILTGNCGTDCCRAGIGGRCLEAIYFPDRFEESMLWEEAMRNKGGSLAGRAFCSRQINGKKTPFSLCQILEVYVPLVKSYLAAHPGIPVSEKTIIKDAKKWARQQAKIDAAPAVQQALSWQGEE